MCIGSRMIQYGDIMAIDRGQRQQLPLGILFDELNALVLRETDTSLDIPVPHKMGDNGLDLVHADAINSRHRQYFPCQFDSSVRDHQPSDNVVRSPLWSHNLLCSQDHSLFRKNISYHCSDGCLAHELDNLFFFNFLPEYFGWWFLSIYILIWIFSP